MALVFVLTGCSMIFGWMQQAFEQDTATLPTLPPKNSSLIPLEVLTGFVEYTTPQLSPDGTLILYRHMNDYRDDIIVEDWRTGTQTFISWPEEAGGIPRFSFAPDGRTILFFVDVMGDENFGLYTSDLISGETKTLLPGGENNCYYVSFVPENDDEIYIALLNRVTSAYDLYILNYKTGQKQLVLKNPGDIRRFIIDQSGRLRLITRTDEHAGSHVWHTSGTPSVLFDEKEWTKILSWDYEDADTSGVLSIMQDDTRVLFIDSQHTNTTTLCTFNIETGQTETIFNDPDYDLRGSWTDLELDAVTAVSTEGAYIEWHVLGESFEDDYQALSNVGGVFDIVDSSLDDTYWIVSYHSDVAETDYYIYDMDAKKASFLFNARPQLLDYDFAPMEPFSYRASDGLLIEGYVTFPKGSGNKNLPTVVLVHGGPWARDSWGFNFETQLLANRGYAVLQVNFRGSTGFGKDFIRAGDLEWGGKMHQDILDAVDHAVSKGWTDPERVGVYGASYGGYEALVCAAFSSDVFACAVDAFGPSSLITFLETLPAQWSTERQSLLRAIGDPDTDEAFMKSRSPLYHADQINIPLLIAQGGNDVRVVQRESDQMVEALRKAGVPVVYLLFPDSGHGLNSYQDMHRFYSALEKFFAKHLLE